ncbi:MAG: aminotransferase class I/II-fold pyridoxal phosphate-dependent enzyme [bacterium]|nr:aminotransferase class I/II-fold pyridoxal phosphate-dependent enzyme [bacterium]
MKIRKLHMEDWLADYQYVKYNLAESGYVDYTLGELFSLCGEDPANMNDISLMNPDTRGSVGLRREILKCYHTPAMENVLVTVGVTEALFAFFNVILEPGDEVIVPFPQFQTLVELPAAIGCDIKYEYLTEENGFNPDPARIRELITPKTKLIIINSPHNPTGSLLDEGAIKEIGKIANEHGIYLLFDEHYKFLPLTEGTELLTSGFDLCAGVHDRVVATGSITKCFGLNGLRVGWLIAPPGVIDECKEFKHYLTHVTPPVCDYMAEIALKNRDAVLRDVKKNILANVGFLDKFMERNGHRFDYLEPKGGLVCFPKLKNQTAATPFCRELLDTHGVSLLPGESFGMDEYFRLNFGVKSGTFEAALHFMEG